MSAQALEALRRIREAGNNFTEWSVWAQKTAAWGMQTGYCPEQPIDAPAAQPVGAVVADAAPSRFGSSELQSMIVQRAKQKEAAQENPQASTYPREIWLQAGECSPAETLPYTDGLELTWCWEGIDKMDVRYIRADITPQPAPPEDLGKAIWHLTRVLSYTKACEGMLNVSPAGQVLDAEKFLSANPAKPADVGGVVQVSTYQSVALAGDHGLVNDKYLLKLADKEIYQLRAALAAQTAASEPSVTVAMVKAQLDMALGLIETMKATQEIADRIAAPQPVDGAAGVKFEACVVCGEPADGMNRRFCVSHNWGGAKPVRTAPAPAAPVDLSGSPMAAMISAARQFTFDYYKIKKGTTYELPSAAYFWGAYKAMKALDPTVGAAASKS